MILYEIELNLNDYPQEIQVLVNEMEELDLKGDWLNYSFKAEELELLAKSATRQRLITSSQLDLIRLKYCAVEV